MQFTKIQLRFWVMTSKIRYLIHLTNKKKIPDYSRLNRKDQTLGTSWCLTFEGLLSGLCFGFQKGPLLGKKTTNEGESQQSTSKPDH